MKYIIPIDSDSQAFFTADILLVTAGTVDETNYMAEIAYCVLYFPPFYLSVQIVSV